MARIEKIRELVSGPVNVDEWKQKTSAGWKLVALEWQREIQNEEPARAIIMEEVPYGLRVSADCSGLEEDPEERNVLVQMMELIVEDRSLADAAREMTSRGLKTRGGSPWTPVAIFNMLPRLIEVGPKIFSSADWDARRKRLLRVV